VKKAMEDVKKANIENVILDTSARKAIEDVKKTASESAKINSEAAKIDSEAAKIDSETEAIKLQNIQKASEAKAIELQNIQKASEAAKMASEAEAIQLQNIQNAIEIARYEKTRPMNRAVKAFTGDCGMFYNKFMNAIINSRVFLLNNRHHYTSSSSTGDTNINLNYNEFAKHCLEFFEMNNYSWNKNQTVSQVHSFMKRFPGVEARCGMRGPKFYKIDCTRVRSFLKNEATGYTLDNDIIF
jgi:hypothetical protein